MAFGRNSSLLRELSEGDLIEVNLGIFSHWGVYVGGQSVIHLAGLTNDRFPSTLQDELFSISGVAYSKAEARMDDFWTFIGAGRTNTAQINNSLDTMYSPLRTLEIIRKAQSSLGVIDYSRRTKNCENFAKWCRYGDYDNAQDQHGVVSRYAPARGRNSSDRFGNREEKQDLEETNIGVAGIAAGIGVLALGAYSIYKLFSGDSTEEAGQEKKYADHSSSSDEVKEEPCMSRQMWESAIAAPHRSRFQKEDRYFGRFRCNNCHIQWESANVYTVAGTKKVKYGQKCKRCNGDWIKPYELQLITCSVCDVNPCVCRCTECGKLKNKPHEADMPTSGHGYIHGHYCTCGKRTKDLGDKINPKKPHPSEYCEKCQKGFYCTHHRRGF